MAQSSTTMVNCKACGALFRAYNYELQKGWGVFCSRRCSNSGVFNPNYKGGLKSNYEYKKAAIAKNPLRFRVEQRVRYAIKTGRLTRLPCGVCGNPKSEAHHEDYSKPLDVVWLCRKHHIERHTQIRSGDLLKPQ